MNRLGLAAVSGAAVLWAAGAVVGGRLFERGASPLELTAARSWIAVTGLGLLVAASRGARSVRPPRRVPGWAIVPFGLSIAAANYFYYFSISRLPVAIAIVTQYTAPGMVVVWTAVAAGRAPSRRVVGALVLALAGVAMLAELPSLVAEGSLRLDGLGLAAAIASAVAFAAYMLMGESMGAALGPPGALVRGFAVASVFWAIVVAVSASADTLSDLTYWPGLAFVGVGATIVPFLLFLWGLGRIGASQAGIVSTLEPVAASVFALVWLDQTLGAVQLAGAVMVVAGIAFVRAERPRSPAVLAETAAVE